MMEQLSGNPLLLSHPFAQPAAIRSCGPLLLVVHGRAGGLIPEEIRAFSAALAARRRSPVAIEALTAECRPPFIEPELTLVPLLLLPGVHVCRDVPAIRQRLRGEGLRVRSVPFLGSWRGWLQYLSRWVQSEREKGRSPLLVHHPLSMAAGCRYLSMLEERLCLPLLRADGVAPYCADELSITSLLPLALAPNRMTEALAERFAAEGKGTFRLEAPCLLGHAPTRSFLLDLLQRLP